MAPETIAAIIDEVVEWGSGDWFYFASVVRLTAIATGVGRDDAATDDAICITRRLLENGLAVAGELPAKGKNFQTWPGDVDELITRITQECDIIRARNKPIQMGDVCWLALTPQGYSM